MGFHFLLLIMDNKLAIPSPSKEITKESINL